MSARCVLMLVGLAAIVGCSPPGETGKPQIVPPGSARTLEFPGHLTTVLLDGSSTEGDVAVLELVVAPRSFGAPPHVHHDEDEYFYVLEGEIQFLNEDRVASAPVGTFAAMPRGHLHAFWNASDAPSRLLLAISPGELGAFFDQVVAELRANATVDAAEVGETIVRIGKRWNIEVHPELVPDVAKPFLPR